MTLCLALGGGFNFGPAGSELYEQYEAVRDACAQVADWTGLDFPALLEEDFTTRPEQRIDAQLRQVALSFGVADLFAGMGVRPRAIGGISIGGMIGSALAGAISRRDLCEIIKLQEKVPASPPDGRVHAFAGLVIPEGEDEQWYVGEHRPDIYLGANSFGTMADGSRLLMISGYLDRLTKLVAEVDANPDRPGSIQIYEGWGALHCPLNQYIKDVMAPIIALFEFHDPTIPLFSARIPGQNRTAEQVRLDFQENYTSFVSVVHLHTELAKAGVQMGITPASGTAPEMNRYPFPVIQVQTPEDVEEALSTLYELGIDLT